MRNTPNVKAERYRIHDGAMGSDATYGNNGAFLVPQKNGPDLVCVVSDGTCPETPEASGWEHVSVSTQFRSPTWQEMCLIKDLFWRDDEVVFQLHPARKDWINCHQFTLHLWRKRGEEPPLPPGILVGFSVESTGEQVHGREVEGS